jgi:hypothetical protein
MGPSIAERPQNMPSDFEFLGFYSEHLNAKYSLAMFL